MDAYNPDLSGSRERRSRDRGGSWLGWSVAIIAVLVVLAVLFLNMNNDAPQRVAIADVEDPASEMTGESVTVEGEVDASLSEGALTVRDDASDAPLLVIAHSNTIVDGVAPALDAMDVVAGQPDPFGGGEPLEPVGATEPILPPLPETGPIRVIGTVETFDRAAAMEQHGISLDEETIASFEGGPYLLANEIVTDFAPSTLTPESTAGAAAS